MLPLVILSVASLASGLSLTASTGDNSGSSSTHVVYGATVDDYAKQHIKLNTAAGTLSNDFSGSGNLRSSSISIKDSKSNYAYVSRSVSGKPGVTTWNYDWSTYKAYSPTAGNGVGAWLTLTADNAYSITGGSLSSNREGDSANGNIYVGNSNLQPTSLLHNYHTEATAFTNAANADQSLDSASGSLVDVKSHAQNTRFANEYLSYSNGVTKLIPTYYGGADFEVQASALSGTIIAASATSSNVAITPTLPTSIKNAIILEPFKNAFTRYAKATDLGTTVIPDLVGKGYATLRYTDSGASSDKFGDLGQYDVVLVDSHMDSGNIGLSTYNPITKWADYIPASQLTYTSSKNSLVIFAGCDSFGGYPTQSASPLATAISGAYLSGGYANTVSTNWNNDYLGYFFDALKAGQAASQANTYANNLATKKYGTNQYYLPLVFYPINWQNDFKL